MQSAQGLFGSDRRPKRGVVPGICMGASEVNQKALLEGFLGEPLEPDPYNLMSDIYFYNCILKFVLYIFIIRLSCDMTRPLFKKDSSYQLSRIYSGCR